MSDLTQGKAVGERRDLPMKHIVPSTASMDCEGTDAEEHVGQDTGREVRMSPGCESIV